MTPLEEATAAWTYCAAGTPLPEDRNGVLLPIDKPKGLSSFGVVRVLRRVLGVKKIGHAGTLDPMATGLLLCAVGRKATRQIDTLLGADKRYTGTLRLGETTPSYDAETEVLTRRAWDGVTDDALAEAVATLTGPIMQQPPMYSAVKVGGERLYKKARRGETVARAPRPVTVYAFTLTHRTGPDVSFAVHCSKGTYIRTLAHDLGQHLGTGAHLTALRRTAIATYTLADAWTLDALKDTLEAAP